MAEIIQTILTAFTTFLTGLSGGLVDTATTLFMGSDGKITTLAAVVLTFGGVSIAFAVVKWVLGLVNLK